jgi:hypothetical protein
MSKEFTYEELRDLNTKDNLHLLIHGKGTVQRIGFSSLLFRDVLILVKRQFTRSMSSSTRYNSFLEPTLSRSFPTIFFVPGF